MKRLTATLSDERDLERLVSSARPLGLRPTRTSFELFRETYFDTRARDLAERGMALRLRHTASGAQVLEFVVAKSVSLQGVVDEEIVEEPVVGGGVYAMLRGPGEIARRVREVTTPAALRPVLALDIDRESQDLRAGIVGRSAFRGHFDRVEAHTLAGEQTWYQVTLMEHGKGRSHGVSLGSLCERLTGVVARRDVRDVLSVAPPVEHDSSTGGRDGGLSVVAIQGGRVFLERQAGRIRLPWSPGSGEGAAGTLGRRLLDPDGSDSLTADLLGFVPVGGGPDQEVWLIQGQPSSAERAEAGVTLPLLELLERLGTPDFRDAGLVRALLLLVRSGFGRDFLSAAARAPAPPSPVVEAVGRPEGTPLGDDPGDFLDGDLSILDFNLRVLGLAEDTTLPVLERLRFLAISASNLDEFFVVRVGRFKAHAEMGAAADDAALPADLLLEVVAVRVRAYVARQHACLERILGGLATHGVRLVRWPELDDTGRAALATWFHRHVFPVVTPRTMTGSAGQPFPMLESLGLSLAVRVTGPDASPYIAHLRIPQDLPRVVPLPGGTDLIPIEDVVAAFAAAFFPSSSGTEAFPFRVSRLGDTSVDSELSESLLDRVADEVADRPYGPVVRLEVDRTMPRQVRARLLRDLRGEAAGSEGALLGREDIYESEGLLDLGGFADVPMPDVPDGRFHPFTPRRVMAGERSMFEVLAERDLLLHHPYDAFDDSVGRFLQDAADDPRVMSIRMTLYRTERNAPVIHALLAAIRAGKDVSVFVELQARFDEERNIEWTHRLRNAGAHVVYGVPGYKTHAKTALVVRREADGRLVRYSHVGTGNYNAATARAYTDFSLLTADETLGVELNDFFNELTGSTGPPTKAHSVLRIAPHGLADGILACIEREVDHARAGRPAGIRAKMNGLSDRTVIRALYEASGEGVEIDLVVRSMCTLRPGVPGLSERVRVRSILGRFLEHGRVYWFQNGGRPQCFIGSADWRKRNLRRRVEVVAEVRDPTACRSLDHILGVELGDPNAWVLGADGRYRTGAGGAPPAQSIFIEEASDPDDGTGSASGSG